jgi:hypothetical protein
MTDNGEEYITVEQVASTLRVSVRHAARYAERVRTQKAGKRILFHRGDIEALADELGAQHKPAIPQPAELVPLGEMMQTFERQQAQIAALSHEVGRLQGILEQQRLLTEDANEVRRRLIEVETQRDMLQQELDRIKSEQEQPKPSWWRRLFAAD